MNFDVPVKVKFILNYSYTVKPVLSGHRIKRTPSIKWKVAEVPKFIYLQIYRFITDSLHYITLQANNEMK